MPSEGPDAEPPPDAVADAVEDVASELPDEDAETVEDAEPVEDAVEEVAEDVVEDVQADEGAPLEDVDPGEDVPLPPEDVQPEVGEDAGPDVPTPSCEEGQELCGEVCVDTNGSQQHCGGCDSPCTGGSACSLGQCVCPPYHAVCGGVCTPTNFDPMNCGGCGEACGPTEVCSGGACKSSCLPGQTACSGTCVDVESNSEHCGGCDDACPQGQGCVSGSCQPTIADGPGPEGCVGAGSPIVIEQGDSDVCAGQLAQVAFTWSLCSCSTVKLPGPAFFDAYDSAAGPYEPGGTGGGVGANGTLTASEQLSLGGTLWSSATSGVSLSNPGNTVDHELHSGGSLSSGSVVIGADAFVAGNVSGNVSIAGDLYVPEGAMVGGGVSASSVVTGPVAVPPPCKCDAEEIIPVGAIVAARAADNDNATIGLAADALANLGPATHLELPCGHYYLDAVTASKPLTILATGRTALYIGGDVTSTQELRFATAPSAEFDIFIAGTLATNEPIVIGSPNFPALTRVYVGGSAPIKISESALIGAYLYAPHAAVQPTEEFEMYGGLVAGSFSGSDTTTIHYDRAVLSVGVDCTTPPPAEGCSSCADCGNQACVDGACGACETSADCCSPLVCIGGQCLTLGVIIDQ